MLGGTKAEWDTLVRRVVKGSVAPEKQELLLGIIEHAFQIPALQQTGRPTSVTRKQLARIAAKAAVGKNDSIEGLCKANRLSQRTFWRHFLPLALPEFQMQVRTVLHRIFQLAKRRFGLMRRFEIYIDEHQTLVFGRVRKTKKVDQKKIWIVDADDVELTEVGLMAGPSKVDKYGGKFHALTFQVMVARCRRSGIILPLDIVLVATEHPLLVGNLTVPGRSREWIIDHFMGVLEAAYPPASLILFDRGYHANANYARVARYCARYGCLYMTPAVSVSSDITDSRSTKYSSVRDFVIKNFPTSQPIAKRSSTRYAIGHRLATSNESKNRTVLAFYRLREPKDPKDEDAPEIAIELGDYRGFAFYINHPNPEPVIQWWERAYSRRWAEENFFKKRAANFHDGRAHKIVRRMFIFVIGALTLAIYALLRGITCPKDDVRWVSRHFNLPDFVLQLQENLGTAVD